MALHVRWINDMEDTRSIGLWQSPVGSGQIAADENALKLFGLKGRRGTMDSRRLLRRVHREDRVRVQLLTSEGLASGKAFDTTFRIVSGRGKVRWLRARGRCLPDLHREPACFLCLICEVSDPKFGEAHRSGADDAADHRLRNIEAIYNAAHVGLFILDRDLRYVRVNRLMAEMNGLAPEAHLGKTLREVTPDLAPKAELVAREVLDTGQAVLNVELSGTTPAYGGQVRHWIGQWLPHKDDEDRVVGINVVAEDVTERREIEGRLARTEKLAALGRLGGGVAHELRTPLGAIKNAVYFLNMALERPAPDVKEALEILNREVDTCDRVVGELLDFGRSRPPLLQPVDLNRVIEQVLERTRLPEKIEPVLDLTDPLPAVKADPHQIAQVIGNLVHNAFQAMPDGGRMVIRTASEKPNWISVSVTDTGVGIPKAEIPKLFQPLYTTKATGIGLGLAISRSLVEGHGGSIVVRSREGQGSTFKVHFPVEKAGRA